MSRAPWTFTRSLAGVAGDSIAAFTGISQQRSVILSPSHGSPSGGTRVPDAGAWAERPARLGLADHGHVR